MTLAKAVIDSHHSVLKIRCQIGLGKAIEHYTFTGTIDPTRVAIFFTYSTFKL